MIPEDPNNEDNAPADRRRKPALLLCAALLLASVLAFTGLDNHPLWTDEANTALFTRNLLATGKLTAWDGHNVFAFNWGSELDENLEQAFMPAQPYYITAAAYTIAGESTFATRAPFALIGVLAIGLTAWWTRRLFGPAFPWYLPAFLLALQPAFLLFIRNARYYSPGVFWTAALLLVWSVTTPKRSDAARPPASPGRNAVPCLPRQIARIAIALLCVAGLFTSQTIYAVAALAMLPVFFLDPAFRNRSQTLLFAVLAVAGAIGVVLVLQHNAGDLFAERRAGIVSWLAQLGQLFWRQIRDLGPFEFFAWPLVLPLFLPWIHPRLATLRPVAKTAFILLAAFLVYLSAVAGVSPQNPETSTLADMRYALPLVTVGAVIASVALVILWRTSRPLGVVVAVLLVTTNLFYIGPRRGQPRFLGDRTTVRSTLFDYLQETTHPYRSTNAALIDYLDDLPAGTKILTSPLHLSFPAMVYVPDLLYCEQLDANNPIQPDLRAQLPEDLFRNWSKPDAVLIIPQLGSTEVLTEIIELPEYRPNRPKRKFRFGGMIETHVPDMTRPEIPLRLFHAPPEPYQKRGILVYFPMEPATPPPDRP